MATESFANSEILVNTEWLNSHIDDPDIRIIDCDMFDSYARAHIKGAVGIKVHHYIKHPSYSQDSKSYPLVAEPDVVKELEIERVTAGTMKKMYRDMAAGKEEEK